jgi:hypothetical protein
MSPTLEKEAPKVQTTLRVPERLMNAVKELLEQNQIPASSVNDVIVAALQRFVDEVREKQIDDAFAEMGKDQQYLAESQALASEFATADRESLPKEDRAPETW